MLPILLGACVTSPSRVTQAALVGDMVAVDEFLGANGAEIDKLVLLDAPSPNCPGQNILTLLQAAACSGREEVVRKLLAKKADPNLATAMGQTPLMLAIANGHGNVARMLVESGALLESADAAGNTPLMLAAARGDRPLADVLLKYGASPKARNKAGETALLLANEAGLARMLAALGADPLAISANGDSGLHMAARAGNAQTAKFFLDQGVEVGLKNRDGVTALSIARSSAGAPANDNVRATMASKRRAYPKANSMVTPRDPELARKRAEVASLIEDWMANALNEEVAVADRTAQEGRSAEALSRYTVALAKAMDIGGTPERELRLKIVRYASSLPQLPAIPEEAREHLVRSSYLLKKGQDMSLIENEVAAALEHAPWWA